MNDRDGTKAKESTPQSRGIPKLQLVGRWDPTKGLIVGFVPRDAHDDEMVAQVTYANLSALLHDLSAIESVAHNAVANMSMEAGYRRGLAAAKESQKSESSDRVKDEAAASSVDEAAVAAVGAKEIDAPPYSEPASAVNTAVGTMDTGVAT